MYTHSFVDEPMEVLYLSPTGDTPFIAITILRTIARFHFQMTHFIVDIQAMSLIFDCTF